MLLASLIGIVFTPALYSLFQRLREWVKRKLHWRESKAEVSVKEYSKQPV
jgi:hypothetical protein